MLPNQTTDNQAKVYLPQVFQNALLDNVDDAVISTDKSFNVLTWNRSAEIIYGIKANEALGRSTKDLFNYEFIDSDRDTAKAELLNNHFWKGIVKFTRKDKVQVILDASVTEIISDTKEHMGYVAVNRDITESTYLHVCLDTFKFTLSLLEEGVYIVHENLTVSYINQKAKKTLLEIYGKMFKNGSSLVDEVPEEYRAKVQENLEAAFKGRPYVHQFSMIKKDLSFVSVVIKYCPVENVFGKIDSVCVIMKNNTKQKLAEHIQERLQSSKEMFEEFMDCNSLLAWIADEDGIMRYMNRTYLKIFRITNTYKGKHMSELFPAEISEKYISNNKLALSKGGPTTTVEQAMLPNGSIKTYKVCKFPIFVKGPKLIGGWAVDISDELSAFTYLQTKF